MSLRSHCTRLVLFAAIVALASKANATVAVLYTFDNPGDTASSYVDNITSDGAAQNATNLYSYVGLDSGAGIGPSTAAHFDPSHFYSHVFTSPVINYPTALTWTADVKISSTPAWDDGLNTLQTTLFWAGWQRGQGETHFAVEADGSLSLYRAGTGLFATAPGLVEFDRWASLGVTFDSTVAGGTLTFYVDKAAVQSFTGLGAPTDGNGNAGSETVFGQAFNLTGVTQLHGYADNIYISDGARTAGEMSLLQAIPEPSSLSLLMLGALVGTRRRRRTV